MEYPNPLPGLSTPEEFDRIIQFAIEGTNDFAGLDEYQLSDISEASSPVHVQVPVNENRDTVSVEMDVTFLKNVNAFTQVMLAQQGFGQERVELVGQISSYKEELEVSKQRCTLLERENIELRNCNGLLREEVSRLKSDVRSMDNFKQKVEQLTAKNSALMDSVSALKQAHPVIIPCGDGEVFLRYIRKVDENYLAGIEQSCPKTRKRDISPVASSSSSSSSSGGPK